MGVYGEDVRQAGDPPVITENLSVEPSDFYGFSKRVCEEVAAFYYRPHGIQTIAYRLGMFVPERASSGTGSGCSRAGSTKGTSRKRSYSGSMT